jgi:hypothetical protein
VGEDVPSTPTASTSYRSIWDKADVPIVGERLSLDLSVHDTMFAVFSGCGDEWRREW